MAVRAVADDEAIGDRNGGTCPRRRWPVSEEGHGRRPSRAATPARSPPAYARAMCTTRKGTSSESSPGCQARNALIGPWARRTMLYARRSGSNTVRLSSLCADIGRSGVCGIGMYAGLLI